LNKLWPKFDKQDTGILSKENAKNIIIDVYDKIKKDEDFDEAEFAEICNDIDKRRGTPFKPLDKVKIIQYIQQLFVA